MASTTEDNRLGTVVKPSHYDLTIRTDVQKRTFSGCAEIELELSSSVPAITLNVASPLSLKAAVLSTSSSSKVRPASAFSFDEKRERVSITFEDGKIEKGKAKVGLRWEGELNESLKGYYLCKMEERSLDYVLTQFQPTSARRAFPCFDEPNFKATYTLSMISKNDTVSIANSDLKSTSACDGSFPRTELLSATFFSDDFAGVVEKEMRERRPAEATKDKWEISHFSPTPPISSYLVAFANGPLEHLSSFYTSPLTSRKIPLQIFATKADVKHAQLALDTTAKALPLYETTFDIPYPLKKLDTLVARNFDLGAMENWGLITGRTSAYLWDEQKSGIGAKKAVVGVASHELSHQWFGNIVTMTWWDSLWLNESMATLIGEVIMVDKLEPSWKVRPAFVSDHLGRAFKLDSLRSSHPIIVECPDEDSIVRIFDAISYAKGASVLRMLSVQVGEENFIKGTSNYLKKHLYGNARTEALWEGISDVSGVDVAKMMHAWTNKIGFPVVTVEETADGLKVKQNRFLATGDTKPEEDTTLWHIPLAPKVVVDGVASVDYSATLTGREIVIPLKDVSTSTYKLNSDTSGVYRVLYPADRLAKLGDHASQTDSTFSIADRMGLIQDASVLASSGLSRTSGALTLVQKIGKVEKEVLVWSEISDSLSVLTAAWWEQASKERDGLDQLRLNLFSPLVEKLGFEYEKDEDSEVTELRTMSIGVAAACGDKKVLKEYETRFGLLLEKDDESRIPVNLRNSILTQAVKRGGVTEYEKVLQIYKVAATPSHKSAAIAGLCSPQDAPLIDRTLKFMLSDAVTSQDVPAFFANLAGNTQARRSLWKCFKENYTSLMKRFAGNFGLGNIVRASFSTLSTFEDAEEIMAFFATQKTEAIDSSIQQGLEAVRSKAAWIQRDSQDVHDWLVSNTYL